jgi:uncharacterized protein YraI
MMRKTFLAAGAAFFALAGVAAADQAVTSTTDLNVRAGPGPQYPVVGMIPGGGNATLDGCVKGSKWCMVAFQGGSGWVFSDYLTADMSGSRVVVTERLADVPTVQYEDTGAGAAAGLTTGAIAGAIIGGPGGAIGGAIIGGAAGGVAGGAIETAVSPPDTVRTYVRERQVDPVYLDGEVVVGAKLPESARLYEIPDYQYRYVYLNNQRVLVEPGSRRIVYVER